MRFGLGIGLAAATAVVAIAAAAGLVVAQERPSSARLPPGDLPLIQSIAVEASGADGALLLVEVAKAPKLPGSFDYPYEAGTVMVNDQGRQGDRRAGDGVYSGAFAFDLAKFERDVKANVARMTALNQMTAPPARSTRFTPVGPKGLQPVGREAAPRLAAQRLTADKTFRALALRDARAAVTAFALPPASRPREVFRLERAGGDIRTVLFGRTVPIGVLLASQVSDSDVVPERSLVITDPRVVEDQQRTFDPCNVNSNPDGVWTFKHLMTQMANTPETGITPEEFVWNWLTLSAFAQEDNSFIAGARPNYVTMVRDQWLAQSGGSTLNLNIAPFRLLAIVSRTDLAKSAGGYSGGNAGEARFVFGVLNPSNVCSASPPASTVILEYGVRKSSCSAKKAWIQSWFNLGAGGLVMDGSGAGTYNQALEALTQQFVMAGTNPTQLPNRSSISQIRTNDLIGGPWTLYEYRLRPTGMMSAGQLDLVTVKQTPDITFRQTPARIDMLASFINTNQAALINQTHVVPPTLPNGHPFLGAESPTANNIGFTWTNTPFSGANPVLSAQALSMFSVNTCNGCHTGDTATTFTHVKPRASGAAALLSAFMSTQPDPGNAIEDDIERRQRMMATALNSSCLIFPMTGMSLAMVH